eukprot:604253-Pyramimonas_sp.AAC.1
MEEPRQRVDRLTDDSLGKNIQRALLERGPLRIMDIVMEYIMDSTAQERRNAFSAEMQYVLDAQEQWRKQLTGDRVDHCPQQTRIYSCERDENTGEA